MKHFISCFYTFIACVHPLQIHAHLPLDDVLQAKHVPWILMEGIIHRIGRVKLVNSHRIYVPHFYAQGLRNNYRDNSIFMSCNIYIRKYLQNKSIFIKQLVNCLLYDVLTIKYIQIISSVQTKIHT